MSDRKLATIEKISEIRPIPDADAIEVARVRGWDVVVRKDSFAVGDTVVYFEVDSLLDVSRPQFEFLAPRGVRTDAEGNTGHVLKTAKLRGQYSQGLVIAVQDFASEILGNWAIGEIAIGEDVTDRLGVIKWEPPVPASLAGSVRGMRPSWIPKTDEERIQNIPEILEADYCVWTPTEKIDGSSCSFGFDAPTHEFHVCSRNLDLLEEDGNTLWRLLRTTPGLYNALYEMNAEQVVIQGEAFGEGIQGNPLKIKGQQFRAFNLILNGEVWPRDEWPDWAKEIAVPEYDFNFPASVEEAVAQVETLKSLVSPERAAEGVVWRADRPDVKLPGDSTLRGSFKVISPRYLLRNDR